MARAGAFRRRRDAHRYRPRAALLAALALLLSGCAGGLGLGHVVQRGSAMPSVRPTGAHEASSAEGNVSAAGRLASAGGVRPAQDTTKARNARARFPESVSRIASADDHRPATALAASLALSGPALDAHLSYDGAPFDGDSRAGGAARSIADADVADIAFDVPTSMMLERRALIHLALRSPSSPANGSEAARYIEARLSGDHFLIEPVTASVQRMANAVATEWMWLVTPMKPGRQQLRLAVSAGGSTDERMPRRALPTFEHAVDVGIAWDDRVREQLLAYADWLWVALWLSAVLALVAYTRRRRRQRWWFHRGL